jgi:hypothetical protein
MQKCLADQIGRNINAYVDDIAIMSKKQDDLIADLQETFNNLRKYNMMLNPTKCIFGVPAGQLLGFIVSHRGIEVNPEKIKAILDISYRGISCRKNTGYHTTDPKIRTQGAVCMRSRSR